MSSFKVQLLMTYLFTRTAKLLPIHKQVVDSSDLTAKSDALKREFMVGQFPANISANVQNDP